MIKTVRMKLVFVVEITDATLSQDPLFWLGLLSRPRPVPVAQIPTLRKASNLILSANLVQSIVLQMLWTTGTVWITPRAMKPPSTEHIWEEPIAMVSDNVTMWVFIYLYIAIIMHFCMYQFNLNIGVREATASWTGPGSWTPASENPICVHFYPEESKPTCCCTLPKSSLSNSDGPTQLSCSCFMP